MREFFGQWASNVIVACRGIGSIMMLEALFNFIMYKTSKNLESKTRAQTSLVLGIVLLLIPIFLQ